MAYERLDKIYKDGQVWDGAAVSRIDDAIEALDGALDSKVVEVERMHYSNNRFDKSKYPLTRGFYVANRLATDSTFRYVLNPTTDGAGSAWLNIPVSSGKTYTMAINDPVTLTDMDNIVYGIFNAIFFLDANGKVVTAIARESNYYYAVQGGAAGEGIQHVAYSKNKVVCKPYDKTSSSAYGMGTSAVTFTVVDESIVKMCIQIGANKFDKYQVASPYASQFCARGHLSDAELAQIQNSFQINEDMELHPYDEFGDYQYTSVEIQSNLTKLQDAFTDVKVTSTNLFDPKEYVVNHKYIANSLTNGKARLLSENAAAVLQIPIEAGNYVLHSNGNPTFGNKKFGYLGKVVFLDEDLNVITNNYTFRNETNIIDTAKARVTGTGTNTLQIKIIDKNIKYMWLPLLDSDKNEYGIWTGYSPTTGLTNAELLELASQIQLNKGEKVLPYQTFDAITTRSYISPDYIMGLDTFQEDMEAKIDDALSNIEIDTGNDNMACIIEGNNIFVRAKRYEEKNDLVWKLLKESDADNRYFNMDWMYTCNTYIPNEDTSKSLTAWKSAYDDCCPVNILGTYLAANHGFNCVDKITATSHGKTDADIGSVWTDTKSQTYVLTHIYDADTLGFVMFNDTNMANGRMGYGNPSAGTTLTHASGATNTNSISIETRESTQLWKSWNNYSLKLFVDGIEQDLTIDTADAPLKGNRVEIRTQYDVIYIPAMLTHLMNNVGNNTSASQNSDEITDSYMTMYINYQFNMNGSLSTYSSFYINKDISVGYIGLVQSMKMGEAPYTYVPDTTYKVLTLHDGSQVQTFAKNLWDSEDKAPYRYYQFATDAAEKGVALVYDRTIGWGTNDIRKTKLSDAGMYHTSKKMYPSFISGGSLTVGTYFDGLAARVPLYKYDPDLTSVGWYWCSDDIILMIDTHNSVNKDIILPDYMNNMRVEVLDKTDSVTCGQTYIFNNKLRFIASEYGYLVARLYK